MSSDDDPDVIIDDGREDEDEDMDDSGPSVVARIAAGASSARDRAVAWLSRNRRTIIRTLTSVGIFAVAALVLRQSWLWAGPLATIVYTLAFLVGASLIPMTVAMLGDMAPAALGKFEFILGQLAFGRGWLVQHDRDWEMHPGREVQGQEQVFIDDDWHAVDDAQNQTILGWQPFGILLSKSRDTLVEHRADPVADAIADRDPTRPDGGEAAVQRGGVKQVDRPGVDLDPDVDPDNWLLDLKRYWSPGLEQMGDITLIEKIEEVTMRKEAVPDRNEARNMVIGSLIGVVLGAATGYVAMGGL